MLRLITIAHITMAQIPRNSLTIESYFSVYLDLEAQPEEMRVQNDYYASELCIDGALLLP